MDIFLPGSLRDYVDTQVGERYGSASEYILENNNNLNEVPWARIARIWLNRS